MGMLMQTVTRPPTLPSSRLGQSSSTSWLDSTVDIPVIGAVNPYLLGAGALLLYGIFASSEGRSYSRAKTARVRSAIHGARLGYATRRVDRAKRKARKAERRLESLQAT